jgi:hypothetical protein
MNKIEFPLPIKAKYHGQEYQAVLLGIHGKVRYAGKTYDTPTAAAKAVALDWKTANGWDFWRFHDSKSGKWCRIAELR